MISESLSGGGDNFTLKADQIPEDILYRTAERRGLNPRNLPNVASVEWWEIEKTLERMDDRWREPRGKDAVIQKGIDEYEEESYDLIITEIPFQLYDEADREWWQGERRPESFYQGEFDVAFIDIDNQIFREVEVKPRRGQPRDENGDPILAVKSHEDKAERQLERHARVFDELNNRLEDFDWKYVGEKIIEKDLKPEYKKPDRHEGDHYWRDEARQRAFNSESFYSLRSNLLTGDYLTLEEGDEIRVVEEGRDMDFLF